MPKDLQEISYKHFGKCVEIKNGAVRLLVTVDVGPRVLFYGKLEGENQFVELDPHEGKIGAEGYRLYGGHRLWHSPEDEHRTYIPDNSPVEWFEEGGYGVFLQKTEAFTQIHKTLKIQLSEQNSEVKIIHGLKNMGAWPITLSPWTVTMLAPGGEAFLPFATQDTGLLPNRRISLWAYSNLNDERLMLREDQIRVACNPAKKEPFKIGTNVEALFAGYTNNGITFEKSYEFDTHARYPDGGVNAEIYVNGSYLELEALGALQTLDRYQETTLTEIWRLREAGAII